MVENVTGRESVRVLYMYVCTVYVYVQGIQGDQEEFQVLSRHVDPTNWQRQLVSTSESIIYISTYRMFMLGYVHTSLCLPSFQAVHYTQLNPLSLADPAMHYIMITHILQLAKHPALFQGSPPLRTNLSSKKSYVRALMKYSSELFSLFINLDIVCTT